MKDSKELKAFMYDMNEFLRKEFGYKRNHLYANQAGNVSSSYRIRKAKLFIRFKFIYNLHTDRIVTFSNVEFAQQRKGHFSRMIYEVCKNAKRYGIELIGLENCLNDYSNNFAKKFGFIEIVGNIKPPPNQYYIKCEDFLRNYERLSSG